MLDQLNMPGGLVLSSVEPAPEADAEGVSLDAAFGELVDRAIVDVPLPAIQTSGDPADGVRYHAFLAEWCLVPGGGRAACAEDGVDEPIPEDELVEDRVGKSDRAGVEGAAGDAVPGRLAPVPSDGAVAADSMRALAVPARLRTTVASAAIEAAPEADTRPGPGVQQEGATRQERGVTAPFPSDAASEPPARLEVPIPERKSGPGWSVTLSNSITQPNATPVDRHVDELARASELQEAPPIVVFRSDLRAADDAGGERSLDGPRSSAASAQWSRAIERLGRPWGEQPPVVSLSDAGSESSGFGETPAFTTPAHAQAGSQGQQGGAHLPAPIFSAVLSADLQRVSAPAPVQAAETPTSPRQLPDSETTRQLVQAMRLQFRDGIGDAIVRLRPEHLGEVSIALRVEHQAVTATVNADIASVRHWLESQEAHLRQGLSEHGLHLEKLVVKEDQSRARGESGAEQRPRQQRRRPAHESDDQARFEVLV